MLMVVDLWTDGSGTKLGEPGGWAYVLECVHPKTGELHHREGSGGADSTTNNRMELLAVYHGLRVLRIPSLVVVHTDSEYVLKAFTERRIESWMQRDWQKVKNADIWLLLVSAVERHMVTWEWVKGHSGVPQNERCDELAGQERRARLSALAEPVVRVD